MFYAFFETKLVFEIDPMAGRASLLATHLARALYGPKPSMRPPMFTTGYYPIQFVEEEFLLTDIVCLLVMLNFFGSSGLV